MIRFALNGAIVFTLIVALTSCMAPILDVKDAQVKTLSGKELTLDQVTKAIVLAGMGLKWEMVVASPGHIIATLNLRGHQAVVDIPYSTSTYSILYKSSVNLTGIPPGKKVPVPASPPDLIHSNYNGWIENLDHAIRTQFIAAGP